MAVYVRGLIYMPPSLHWQDCILCLREACACHSPIVPHGFTRATNKSIHVVPLTSNAHLAILSCVGPPVVPAGTPDKAGRRPTSLERPGGVLLHFGGAAPAEDGREVGVGGVVHVVGGDVDDPLGLGRLHDDGLALDRLAVCMARSAASIRVGERDKERIDHP